MLRQETAIFLAELSFSLYKQPEGRPVRAGWGANLQPALLLYTIRLWTQEKSFGDAGAVFGPPPPCHGSNYPRLNGAQPGHKQRRKPGYPWQRPLGGGPSAELLAGLAGVPCWYPYCGVPNA
jgi:hypothetical protein